MKLPPCISGFEYNIPPPPSHTQSFSKLDLRNWPNTVQCTDSLDHPSTQRFNPSFSHGRRRQASQPFVPNIKKVQATHQAYGWLQSLQNNLWEFPLLGILAQQKNGENKKEEETKRTWQWSRVEIWLKKLLLHVLHVHVSQGLIEIFWTSRGQRLPVCSRDASCKHTVNTSAHKIAVPEATGKPSNVAKSDFKHTPIALYMNIHTIAYFQLKFTPANMFSWSIPGKWKKNIQKRFWLYICARSFLPPFKQPL